MGNIKVLVRDLETVNFDKICCLTLALRDTPFDGITVVSEGASDFDIEGDASDREYWKKPDGRSMTEQYALRTGLIRTDAVGRGERATSGIPGLPALCQSLAENHNKVPGVKGGGLYKKGMIPSYARNLALLPDRASEIVGKLVKAVAASLKHAHPIPVMFATAGSEWDGIDDALSAAERQVYEEARSIARALHEGTYADGDVFPLDGAPALPAPAPVGVYLRTRNPNLMKHLWGVLKSMEPAFKVATAVVAHPDTGRIAILCSNAYRVDVRPVAEALALTYGDDFDVNHDRNSIVWDPRFASNEGVLVQEVRNILAKRLAFRKEEKIEHGPRFGATLADRLGQLKPR